MNDKLEVLITSSSRPQLWQYFWTSFHRMCIIREKPKIIVHEDFVFPEQSEKVVKMCENMFTGIDELNTDSPPLGLGRTLTHYLLKNRLNKKYTFYLQEDWEFERPIDIDKLIWVMDTNPHINLIFFNKIRNNAVVNKQAQEQRTFGGVDMCVYHGWTFNPGIWRTDFVKKHWHSCEDRPEGVFQQQFGSHLKRSDVKYCEEVIGAYIYGKTGEHRYIRHLGNDWRMARWRLETHGGKVVPGGNHNSITMDKKYMAPWVPYPERPVQRGDLANEKT